MPSRRSERAADSSLTLRSKKDLIMDFVDRVSATGEIDDEWRAFIEARRTAELDDIINEEGLKPEATQAFIKHAFRDGAIPVAGTAVTEILRRSPASRQRAATERRNNASMRLGNFFDRFFGLERRRRRRR